jgi:hypothetical protein
MCTAQAQCVWGSAAPPVSSSAPPGNNPSVHADPLRDSNEDKARRAEFSAGRLIGEILLGTALGSGAAYGTYVATCDDDFTKFCLDSYFAAVGANLVGTTVGVWGTGTIFGGDAGLGYTLLGELLPFTATAPFAADNPGLAIGVALALAPITGSIVFELRSNVEAKRLRATAWEPKIRPIVVPVPYGAVGGVEGAF